MMKADGTTELLRCESTGLDWLAAHGMLAVATEHQRARINLA
ncbi:hypothetical protein [Streptomyces bohaiensis]